MTDTSQVLTVTVQPVDWDEGRALREDSDKLKAWMQHERERITAEKRVFAERLREWALASGVAPGMPGPVEITPENHRWSFVVTPRYHAGSTPSLDSLMGLRIGYFDASGPYGHYDVDASAADLALDAAISRESPWSEAVERIIGMSSGSSTFRFLPKKRSLMEFWLAQPLGRWGMQAAVLISKGNVLRAQGKYAEAAEFENAHHPGPTPSPTPIPDTVGNPHATREQQIRDLLLGLPRKVSPSAVQAVEAVLVKLSDDALSTIAGLCLLQAEGVRAVGQPTRDDYNQLRAALNNPITRRIPELEWEQRPLLPLDNEWSGVSNYEEARHLVFDAWPLWWVVKSAAIAAEMILPLWKQSLAEHPTLQHAIGQTPELIIAYLEKTSHDRAGIANAAFYEAMPGLIADMTVAYEAGIPFSVGFDRLAWALRHRARNDLIAIRNHVASAVDSFAQDYAALWPPALSRFQAESRFYKRWWSELRRRLQLNDLMFATPEPEGDTRSLQQVIEDYAAHIQNTYPGVRFELSLNSSLPAIRLDRIEVPRELRKRGIGTRIMQDFVAWADRHGYLLTLTLAQKGDPGGTSSRARLVRFYKRFGFVENKGRRADSRISASMYRHPQPPETVQGMEHAELPKGEHPKYGRMDVLSTGEGKLGHGESHVSPLWLPADQRGMSLRFPGPSMLIRYGNLEEATPEDEHADIYANVFNNPFTVVDPHVSGRLLVLDQWYLEEDDPWLVDFDLATGRMYRYPPGELLLQAWHATVTAGNHLLIVDAEGHPDSMVSLNVVDYDLSSPELTSFDYITRFSVEAPRYAPLGLTSWKGQSALVVAYRHRRAERARAAVFLLTDDGNEEPTVYIEVGYLLNADPRSMHFRQDGDYLWFWSRDSIINRALRVDTRTGKQVVIQAPKPWETDPTLRRTTRWPLGTWGKHLVSLVHQDEHFPVAPDRPARVFIADEDGVRVVDLEQPDRRTRIGLSAGIQDGMLIAENMYNDDLYHAWDVKTGRFLWTVHSLTRSSWYTEGSTMTGLPELVVPIAATARNADGGSEQAYRVHALDARTGQWLL